MQQQTIHDQVISHTYCEEKELYCQSLMVYHCRILYLRGLLVDNLSNDMEDGKTSCRLSDDDVINLQTK